MLDEYYKYRVWNESDIPKKEKLKSLSLKKLAMELNGVILEKNSK
jgi:aldehyde:ferredoxin oxidoreductase